MMYRRIMLACSAWVAWSVPSSAKYRKRRPRVLTAGEFLDDVTEEARHRDRRRVDRTDQSARLDDRLTGQILILK